MPHVQQGETIYEELGIDDDRMSTITVHEGDLLWDRSTQGYSKVIRMLTWLRLIIPRNNEVVRNIEMSFFRLSSKSYLFKEVGNQVAKTESRVLVSSPRYPGIFVHEL